MFGSLKKMYICKLIFPKHLHQNYFGLLSKGKVTIVMTDETIMLVLSSDYTQDTHERQRICFITVRVQNMKKQT